MWFRGSQKKGGPILLRNTFRPSAQYSKPFSKKFKFNKTAKNVPKQGIREKAKQEITPNFLYKKKLRLHLSLPLWKQGWLAF